MNRSVPALFAWVVPAAFVLLGGSTLSVRAAERPVPPRPAGAPSDVLTSSEKNAVAEWVLSQPAVRAATAGRRFRVLRVWSDVAKGEAGPYRRATVLVRDSDSGIAREITADLASGRTAIRTLAGVPPSAEEIEEGMRIVRRDPALAAFVDDPRLTLMGGFSNRSPHSDDPCAREMCLEFAFMRPGYARGPARYVVVNLTRGVVAHHDFRGAKAGQRPPRMTEGPGER